MPSQDVKIEVSPQDDGQWKPITLDRGVVFALGGGALRISQGDFMIVLRKPEVGKPLDGFKPVVSEMGHPEVGPPRTSRVFSR